MHNLDIALELNFQNNEFTPEECILESFFTYSD